MSKTLLLAVLAVAALVVLAPAAASATTTLGTAVPNLPSNVHQAYIADGNGDPEDADITLAGPLTVNGAATVSCTSNSMQVTANADGTATVGSLAATGCSVAGFPNCSVDISPENLDWGARLGYDTSSSTYRLYLNTTLIYNFTNTLPNCPVFGAFTSIGSLSPAISISSGVLTAAFGTGSGSTSGPLGTATIGGSIYSVSGVGSDTQLVF